MKKIFSLRMPVVGVMLAAGLTGLVSCGGSTLTNVNLSGTITGLTTSGLILTNGYASLTILANATTFRFSTRLNQGVGYNVGVIRQPDGLTCSVANGTGAVGVSDITDVQIACQPNKALGGVVTGLIGTLVLVNGNDKVTISATDGAPTTFEFANRVAEMAHYGVTILTQPANQTCSVGGNGIGTIGNSDITNIQIVCQ